MNKQIKLLKTTFTKTDVTGDQEVSGAKNVYYGFRGKSY